MNAIWFFVTITVLVLFEIPSSLAVDREFRVKRWAVLENFDRFASKQKSVSLTENRDAALGLRCLTGNLDFAFVPKDNQGLTIELKKEKAKLQIRVDNNEVFEASLTAFAGSTLIFAFDESLHDLMLNGNEVATRFEYDGAYRDELFSLSGYSLASSYPIKRCREW